MTFPFRLHKVPAIKARRKNERRKMIGVSGSKSRSSRFARDDYTRLEISAYKHHS